MTGTYYDGNYLYGTWKERVFFVIGYPTIRLSHNLHTIWALTSFAPSLSRINYLVDCSNNRSCVLGGYTLAVNTTRLNGTHLFRDIYHQATNYRIGIEYSPSRMPMILESGNGDDDADNIDNT